MADSKEMGWPRLDLTFTAGRYTLSVKLHAHVACASHRLLGCQKFADATICNHSSLPSNAAHAHKSAMANLADYADST